MAGVFGDNDLVTPQKIKTAMIVTTGANTDYDSAPGANVLKLLTNSACGGRLIGLWAMPRANVAKTQLQVYGTLNGGAGYGLCDSAEMAAYIFATDTKIPKTDFLYSETNFLEMGPLEEIWVGQGVALAGGIVWRAQYWDYEKS